MFDAKEKRAEDGLRNEAFGQWMEQPTTKVLVSLAPPFEHMEALLRAAFEAGCGVGQGLMGIKLLEKMLDHREGAGRT